MKERAMVVLSGGQDSTVCLYWAKEYFGAKNIEAITFDYGQRHNLEISCAKKIAEKIISSTLLFQSIHLRLLVVIAS